MQPEQLVIELPLNSILPPMLQDRQRLPGQKMEDFKVFMDNQQPELMPRNLQDASPAKRQECEDAVIESIFAAQRARSAVRVLMESGQEDAALVLMGRAVAQGIRPCSASDVRAWFEALKTAGKFPLIEKLMFLAIRGCVEGITTEDVSYWVQILFDNKKFIHAVPMITEVLQSGLIHRFSRETVFWMLQELFKRNCRTGAVNIVVMALDSDLFRSIIKEEDIRPWMQFLFDKGDYINASRFGVSAVDHRSQFPGVTDAEILGWIQKCKDFKVGVPGVGVSHPAFDSACFLLVAAYTNGVQGIRSIDISNMFYELCSEDDNIRDPNEKLSVSQVCGFAMQRLNRKGERIDALPSIPRLLLHEDEQRQSIAPLAIEHGLPGIDIEKVREWVNLCYERKRFGPAVRVLVKALERRIPGIEGLLDFNNKLFAGNELPMDELNEARCAAIRCGDNDLMSDDLIKQVCDGYINTEFLHALGLDYVHDIALSVCASDRQGFSGEDLLIWVNALLKDVEVESAEIAKAKRDTPSHVPAPKRHAQAYEVIIAGLRKGLIEGVTVNDILDIKKIYDDLGNADRSIEILIAAKEAGIDIPDEQIRTSIASYYVAGPRVPESIGANAVKLFAMYKRHSRAQREYPELAALIAGLSDRVAEKVGEAAKTPETLTLEAVAKAVRGKAYV